MFKRFSGFISFICWNISFCSIIICYEIEFSLYGVNSIVWGNRKKTQTCSSPWQTFTTHVSISQSNIFIFRLWSTNIPYRLRSGVIFSTDQSVMNLSNLEAAIWLVKYEWKVTQHDPHTDQDFFLNIYFLFNWKIVAGKTKYNKIQDICHNTFLFIHCKKPHSQQK